MVICTVTSTDTVGYYTYHEPPSKIMVLTGPPCSTLAGEAAAEASEGAMTSEAADAV